MSKIKPPADQAIVEEYFLFSEPEIFAYALYLKFGGCIGTISNSHNSKTRVCHAFVTRAKEISQHMVVFDASGERTLKSVLDMYSRKDHAVVSSLLDDPDRVLTHCWMQGKNSEHLMQTAQLYIDNNLSKFETLLTDKGVGDV